MMSFPFPRPLLALCLAGACTASLAADAFAPVGAKATLSVEYLYESADKKQDKYDLYEWRVKRGASLVVELVAQSAQAMPTVQAIDASQMAELKGMSAQGPVCAHADGADDGRRPEDHGQVRRYRSP